MAAANELFTSTNIIGVGVATLAINTFTNTLYKLAKLQPKWTAFIASLIVAYIVVFISDNQQWYDWILAFFNACLLFCSAMGINELGASAFASSGQGFMRTEPFIKSWIKK